jgi:intein/homing endonuclease
MYEQLLNNPELSRVVADLTSDGHLQVDNKRYVASFYSKDLQEIQVVKNRFYNLFGIKGKIHTDKRPVSNNLFPTIRYQLYVPSKKMCLFLKDIGTPIGNKTNNPFRVPNWVFKGSSELKSSYLRSMYDAEGSIFCGKDKRWQITFKMAKNQILLKEGIAFFEQIRTMLQIFDIKTSPVNYSKLNIRKDGSTSVYLRITIEHSSFGNFLKHVGFDNKSKQDKLFISLG